MEYRFKGDEYYQALKGTANKRNIDSAWYKYRGETVIGYNVGLMNRYNPRTVEEFYEQYVNDYTTPTDKDHGRSVDMLYEIAKKWKADSNEPEMSEEDFVDMVVLHAVVETFDGRARELEIEKVLSEKGYHIVDYDKIFADYNPRKKKTFDSWSSIDLVIAKGNTIVKMIQIKPISTFRSKNPSTILDRLNFESHNRDGINFVKEHPNGYRVKDNISVDYMIYKPKSKMWYYKEVSGKKTYSFKLSELLAENYAQDLENSEQFGTFDKDSK